MGIVASGKTGSAVVRNRFKRRMRSFFEAFSKKIPTPSNAVWVATQPQTLQWSFGELQTHVYEGLERLRNLFENKLQKHVRSESDRVKVEA